MCILRKNQFVLIISCLIIGYSTINYIYLTVNTQNVYSKDVFLGRQSTTYYYILYNKSIFAVRNYVNLCNNNMKFNSV